MKRRAKGLTLIELMVTLAVAIVLLAIGIPAFNTLTARDVSAATVNALVTALQQARMEAISRGAGLSVVSADWNAAWTVQTAGGEVLRRFDAPRPGLVTVSGGVSPLSFDSQGRATTTTTFAVTAFSDSSKTKCMRKTNVVVTAVGQVRSELVACP